ncbi:MAG: mechanosensitive ion channel, partial [Smithellaceae bacterium]|nr:mechanosensitive ion channel [Smithellaceae bacterium]
MSTTPMKKLAIRTALFALAAVAAANQESLMQFMPALPWAWPVKTIEITLAIVVWFFLGLLINGIFDAFLWGWWEKRLGRPLPKLLKDIIYIAVYFIILILALSFVFKAPISGLVAGSSVMAAVIGLAVTRMISDVFSGVALSLEKAYSIDDWLEIEMKTRPLGFLTGKVVEVNWRATRLLTKAEEIIIIPNSEMAKMKFVNFSIPQRHYRTDIQVYLSHTIPPERVKRVFAAAMKSTPGIMKDPAPKITLMRFTERGVLWCARIYIGDYAQHRQVVKTAHEAILRHLQIAGIDLSYNRVDQHNITAAELSLEKRPVKERLVGRIDLFDVLGRESLQDVVDTMMERTFAAKEIVVAQEEEGSSLFVVAEG